MPLDPSEDTTLRHLVGYLSAACNARYPGAIAQVSDFDNIPSDPAAYPHLCVHRLRGQGERLEQCQGAIRYLQPMTDRAALPGQFRALQITICQLLDRYTESDGALAIVAPGGYSVRERILQPPGGLIPFFEIEFSFTDLITG